MQKELWRNRWLSSINELTSLKLQRESWLDEKNTNLHWSFVEFMCSYFDDLGLDDNYEEQLNKKWVSEKEIEAIKNWHDLLNKYDSPMNDDYNNKLIINDKDWNLIIQEGLKAVINLSKYLNESEVQILTEEMDYISFNKSTNYDS